MFVCGALCGALLALCAVALLCALLPEEKPAAAISRLVDGHTRQRRENRNFLYYDGTEMPMNKEEQP